MRSTTFIAGLATAALFAAAGPAHADSYCVASPSACPAEGTPKADVQAALTSAQAHPGHDQVLIGSGTFTTATGFSYASADPQNTVEIAGEGDATVLQADTPAKAGSGFYVAFLQAAAPSSIGNVKIVVPDAADGASKPAGLSLRNGASAESIHVTDSGSLTLPADMGVELVGGGITDSKVHMNDNADAIVVGWQPVTIADSSLRAERAILASSGGAVTVKRSRIRGQDLGAYIRGGTMTVESSVVETTAASSVGLRAAGVASFPTTKLSASHVTLVGAGLADSSGVMASTIDDGDAEVELDNSVITGFARGLRRSSTDADGIGEAKVAAANVNYDKANDLAAGAGTFTVTGDTNHAPGFVDAAAKDFRLAAGSALIGAGRSDAFVALGATDLDGLPRTRFAARDLGAHEYQGVAPVAVISGALTVQAGTPLTLSGAQSHDDDAGDSITSWMWTFGDGTDEAFGSEVAHTWIAPGTYDVYLNVADGTGKNHVTTVPVVVTAKPAPAPQDDPPADDVDPSKVPSNPATGGGGLPEDGTGGPTPITEERVTTTTTTTVTTSGTADVTAPAITLLRRSGRTVRFTLGESATVRIAVERRTRSGRYRAARAAKSLAGKAGPTTVKLGALRPGSYRVVVTATDAAGNKTTKRLAFRVAR